MRTTVTYYEEMIMKATGCPVAAVSQVEDHMRNIVLHGACLDGLSKQQFNSAAKVAWKDVKYINSPAGQEYLTLLEMEITTEIDPFRPVKYSKPQAGEEGMRFKVVNYNSEMGRCYIKLICNEYLPSQELVSVDDIVNA